MTRSGRVDEEPTKEALSEDDDVVQDQDQPAKPDPKQAQRMAALQKAQTSRMANAEIKRKEKALSDYESLQRKDEISRKFDELQERLGNKPKPKPKPVIPKEEPKDDTGHDDEPVIPVKKPKKTTPKRKKQVPKQAVYVEESESSSSEDDEPPQVVINKKKKTSKPKKKVVYESGSDSSSDDERGQTIRRTAAMYYKLMFS